MREVIVIHAISHRASPPLNNHRERGQRSMNKHMNDCVCTCMCDRDRAMGAACDYSFLISNSKRESARLLCIITKAKRGNVGS